MIQLTSAHGPVYVNRDHLVAIIKESEKRYVIVHGGVWINIDDTPDNMAKLLG